LYLCWDMKNENLRKAQKQNYTNEEAQGNDFIADVGRSSLIELKMEKPIKVILHEHLLPFELEITELGIKGRIAFEESMISAMQEYSKQEKNVFKEKLKNGIDDI